MFGLFRPLWEQGIIQSSRRRNALLFIQKRIYRYINSKDKFFPLHTFPKKLGKSLE